MIKQTTAYIKRIFTHRLSLLGITLSVIAAILICFVPYLLIGLANMITEGSQSTHPFDWQFRDMELVVGILQAAIFNNFSQYIVLFYAYLAFKSLTTSSQKTRTHSNVQKLPAASLVISRLVSITLYVLFCFILFVGVALIIIYFNLDQAFDLLNYYVMPLLTSYPLLWVMYCALFILLMIIRPTSRTIFLYLILMWVANTIVGASAYAYDSMTHILNLIFFRLDMVEPVTNGSYNLSMIATLIYTFLFIGIACIIQIAKQKKSIIK